MKKITIAFVLVSLCFTNNLLLAEQQQNDSVQIDNLVVKINQSVDKRVFDQALFSLALKSKSINTKIAALQGLGRIGGEQILSFVTPFVHDNNEQLRRAAVFAFGISGATEAIPPLWLALEKENSEVVKQEIYLSLGNLGGVNLVVKMLSKAESEENIATKAIIFQALATAISSHPDVSKQIDTKKSQSAIDFNGLLALMERDDSLSYSVGYFLARVKKIQKQINPAQLQRFMKLLKSTNNKKMFARLIGKITKNSHLANRRLLSWLIEQTQQDDVSLTTEAISAMATLIDIPQAKIQLGKLTDSKNQQIAQAALKVMADSSLTGMHINKVLKHQLKNANPGMVVEAMSGLIQRQKREDMTWAFKILSHKSTYVRIKFAQMIAEKDKDGFKNVIAMLSKDKDELVSKYAKSLLSRDEQEINSQKLDTSTYVAANQSNGKIVALKTSAGTIKIRLNEQATYTSANFENLVKQGFYNKSYFSRVIGNFVVQGGDSIGNGEGSSGLSIREEISYLSHRIGTVGMATAGKDTGDSQFFINIGDNIHLDRRYTIFGDVIEGMENVYRLGNGDQIISAEILK